MAEINVEKKSNFPWWIWLVVALIIIAILFFLLGGDNQADTGTRDDTQSRPGTTEPDTVRRGNRPGTTSEIAPVIPEYEFVRMDERFIPFTEFG